MCIEGIIIHYSYSCLVVCFCIARLDEECRVKSSAGKLCVIGKLSYLAVLLKEEVLFSEVLLFIFLSCICLCIARVDEESRVKSSTGKIYVIGKLSYSPVLLKEEVLLREVR